MKKLIAFALILTMLVSIFAVNSAAATGILVQSDFNDMERFTQSFHAGAYYVEDKVLFGYDEAKCLQSKSEHYVYDTSITVVLSDDDLSDTKRSYSLWYCNTNLMNYGRWDGSFYMLFNYDIETQMVTLGCADINGGSEPVNLAGPISYPLEDEKEVTFGLSVTRGRLRGFINGEQVFDYIDTNDDYLIGLQDEATTPTALVYWNEGNFIQIKDVKIASAEFLYPIRPDAETTATTATTPKATSETTTRIENVEVTDDKGNAVTDEAGNKVTEQVIITEPPVADTNTGAVQGGNSTSTGDKAVMVVCAMIAALGCAIIVKKVHD